ncbi:MAG: hypothetical protein MJY56_06140 [Bacteroidales bacterium]|nr:hypothetical protein [Bacteroidales bacterium]
MRKCYPTYAMLILSLLCSCSNLNEEIVEDDGDAELFESFDSNHDIGVISGDGVPSDVCFPREGWTQLNRDKDGNILPESKIYAAAKTDEYGSEYNLEIVFRESPGKIVDNDLEFVSGRVNADMYISYMHVPAHSPGFPADGLGGPTNAYHVKVRLSGSPELHTGENGECLKGEVKMIMIMANNDKFLFLFNELTLTRYGLYGLESMGRFYTWPEFPQILIFKN